MIIECQIPSWINEVLDWETIKSFGNSAFTTSLLGALAGAYFGSTSAQKVAERSRRKNEFVKEIRNVNAAIALAFAIVNGVLALKKQNVAPMKADYEAECDKHKIWLEKRRTGQIQGNAPFSLKADFRTTPTISQPIEVLKNVVFSQLSNTGRILNLVASLDGAIESLNTAISQRNELIELFKAEKLPPTANLPAMYLSLPYGDGHVNQQYADLVKGIASYADDSIFMSHLLCLDLVEYGKEVSDEYVKTLGGSPLKVTQVDFEKATESGQMPNREQYSTWFTAFQKQPKKESRKWWRGAA